MDAGKLVHKVSLQRIPVTQVSGREVRGAAEVYAPDVRANVRFLSGNELWKAQQVTAQVNVRVMLRYRTDVSVNDQVVYGERVLEIKAVIPDEERRESLQLECVTNG